ncbi:MAG: hypothetical protein CV089_19390 [Nitrospira sp. WS110]|nr:hypothetical protein [Nitrospira sp. WS110]
MISGDIELSLLEGEDTTNVDFESSADTTSLQVCDGGSMELFLNIVDFGGQPLPAGKPLKVEIRDTSLADAPAVTLHQMTTVVPPTTRTVVLPVKLELASVPVGTTVWVHVDMDGDGRVGKGDLVTVESYPVASIPRQTLTVRVKKVG